MAEDQTWIARITVSDGNDFHSAIHRFGYESYQQAGRGIVTIQEGDLCRHPDGRTDAKLYYRPDNERGDIPTEAKALVQQYEPEREVVLAIISNDGQSTVVTLANSKPFV
jgi:hypothetical protein